MTGVRGAAGKDVGAFIAVSISMNDKKMLYGRDRRKYEGMLKRVCARSVG